MASFLVPGNFHSALFQDTIHYQFQEYIWVDSFLTREKLKHIIMFWTSNGEGQVMKMPVTLKSGSKSVYSTLQTT